MRELIIGTNAVPSDLPFSDAVSAMKQAIEADYRFNLISAETIETPESTYVKLHTQCTLPGTRGEEYYQHSGFCWPRVNFFVTHRASSPYPVVYCRSDRPISEDLCDMATNQCAHVIDASGVSAHKIEVVPKYKLMAIICAAIGLIAFTLWLFA